MMRAKKSSTEQAVGRSGRTGCSVPKIGEIWWACGWKDGDKDELEYLFKIVCESRHKGRPCYLGVKCSWKTLLPIPIEGAAIWFSSAGNAKLPDIEYNYSLCGIHKPNPTLHRGEPTNQGENHGNQP